MVEYAPHHPYAITLAHPYIAAAGSLGFGIHSAAMVAAIAPAALITPTITAAGRSPDGPNRLYEHRAGVIYGEPWHDPGLDWVGRRCTAVWATWDIPVIVSLSSDDVDVLQCIRELNQVEGIAGFELAMTDIHVDLGALLPRLRARCDMPLTVKLPFGDARSLLPIVAHCAEAGIDGITLCAPVAVATGRILSPTFGAVTLHLIQSIAPETSMQISACGGIHDAPTADACLSAGAQKVQIGSWVLRDPGCIKRMANPGA